MSAHPRFKSPRLTLGVGIEMAACLKAEVDSFFSGDFSEVFQEPDANPFWILQKLRFTKPFPSDKCGQYTTLALTALRSALDQVGYAAACAAGCFDPTVGNRKTPLTEFPISTDEVKLEQSIARKCGHLPPKVVDVFRAIEPYKTGRGNWCWYLNILRNSSAHNVISASAARLSNMEVHGAFSGAGGSFKIATLDLEKGEYVFARHPFNEIFGYEKLEIDFHPMLHNSQWDISVEPLSFLANCAAAIEQIIDEIEALCLKEGYTK